MTTRILMYVFLMYLAFFGADYLNGLLDEQIASPGLGEYGGHVFSVLRLWGFVIIVIYIFISVLDLHQFNGSDLLFVGLIWIILNFLFMVVYKHYFKRIPWGIQFGDYDIRAGRLKIFILLTELFAPLLLGNWRRSITRRRH